MLRARYLLLIFIACLLQSVSAGIAAPAANFADFAAQTFYNRKNQEDKEVCYEEVGCFTNNYPFYKSGKRGRAGYAPDSPQQVETKFMLYNSGNTYTIVNSSTAHCSVPVADTEFIKQGPHINFLFNIYELYLLIFFDKPHPFVAPNVEDAPTIFLIHGYISDPNYSKSFTAKDELLKYHYSKNGANIIIVDWSKGAYHPKNYPKAVGNTRLIGRQIALFSKNLISKKFVHSSDIHLVGHSLGAQQSYHELIGLNFIYHFGQPALSVV